MSIGRDVEAILGPRHFLYLYLCGAIGGELGHLFSMPATTVLLGGSGGVAAMVVALAIILPELELTESLSFILPVKLKLKYFGYALGCNRRGPAGGRSSRGGESQRPARWRRGRLALRSPARFRAPVVPAAGAAAPPGRERTSPAHVARRIHRRKRSTRYWKRFRKPASRV